MEHGIPGLTCLAEDTLAERLRRRPAKPMGSPRVGSNPTGVDFCEKAYVLFPDSDQDSAGPHMFRGEGRHRVQPQCLHTMVPVEKRPVQQLLDYKEKRTAGIFARASSALLKLMPWVL